MLGTLLLWFGWYGFNAGSAVDIFSADKSLNLPVISASVVNSTLAGSMGGITALFVNLLLEERLTGDPLYKLSGAMNGCLTGLVAVTGSCGLLEPWVAIIIGTIAGLLYLLASHLLMKFCIDDAVDAIPVHLAGGIWGVIATGLFACPSQLKFWYGVSDESLVKHVGWFYSFSRGSGDFSLLACQLAGLAFILAWTTAIMLPFFFVLNYMGLFRSNALEEIVGLDVSYHGFTPRKLDRGEVSSGMLKDYRAKTGKKMHNLGIDFINEEADNEGLDRFAD
jgi:Amt family ammonium transporter